MRYWISNQALYFSISSADNSQGWPCKVAFFSPVLSSEVKRRWWSSQVYVDQGLLLYLRTPFPACQCKIKNLGDHHQNGCIEWQKNQLLNIKSACCSSYLPPGMFGIMFCLFHSCAWIWKPEIQKKGWFSQESNQAAACSPYFYKRGKEQ